MERTHLHDPDVLPLGRLEQLDRPLQPVPRELDAEVAVRGRRSRDGCLQERRRNLEEGVPEVLDLLIARLSEVR